MHYTHYNVSFFQLQCLEENFYNRVFAVALTDVPLQSFPRHVQLAKIAQHWVSSATPLGTELAKMSGLSTVSAGTKLHHYTSGVAFPSVVSFLAHCEEAVV
jgi:phosphotransacetylase